MGLSYILLPKLTQSNGVYINYPLEQSCKKKLSFEKKIYNNIITKINNLGITFFIQNFHHSFTNWLPFYWEEINKNGLTLNS